VLPGEFGQRPPLLGHCSRLPTRSQPLTSTHCATPRVMVPISRPPHVSASTHRRTCSAPLPKHPEDIAWNGR
jgi:hypothetical protein